MNEFDNAFPKQMKKAHIDGKRKFENFKFLFVSFFIMREWTVKKYNYSCLIQLQMKEEKV